MLEKWGRVGALKTFLKANLNFLHHILRIESISQNSFYAIFLALVLFGNSSVFYPASLPPPPSDRQVRRRKKKSGLGRCDFTEGWVEFRDKRVAKKVAASLHNTPMGTKKRQRYYSDLWCIKVRWAGRWPP